jgi:hypothetical protein
MSEDKEGRLGGGEPFARLRNGVRARCDGKGDPWAREHRIELGNERFMTDLDGVMGAVLFERTCADETFCEYVPDVWSNRVSLVRDFALVACFERKRSRNLVVRRDGGLVPDVGTSFLLWLCRVVGTQQPLMPRFFFVFGQCAPWEMTAVDPLTGTVGKTYGYGRGEWHLTWDDSGITRARQELRHWLEKDRSAPVGEGTT